MTVERLLITSGSVGMQVEFRCRGSRCPVKHRTFNQPRGGRLNVLTKLRRYRTRFRTGQTLELRVTAPDRIGKVVRFRLVRNRSAITTTLCLTPGERSPRRCP